MSESPSATGASTPLLPGEKPGQTIWPRATAWIRAMAPENDERGGSQPHLFDTTDGQFMIKVANNPQGARVLPNELISGRCLAWLGAQAPRSTAVEVPPEVVEDSPGAKFQDDTALAPGLAFGSEYWQSDPQGTVDASVIANTADVARTIGLDTWVRQFDGRQYRVRASPHEPGKYDFIPLDQGHSFGNPNWTAEGLDQDRDVTVRDLDPAPSWRQVEAVVKKLMSFSQVDADTIVQDVPEDWLTAAERDAIARYLVERAPLAAEALRKKFEPKERT